jgi:hypothetical protein
MGGDGPLGCLRSLALWAANSWQKYPRLSASLRRRSTVGTRIHARTTLPACRVPARPRGPISEPVTKRVAVGFEGFEGGERPQAS